MNHHIPARALWIRFVYLKRFLGKVYGQPTVRLTDGWTTYGD